MGDVSAEPSMEDILSSIKRIISEDGEGAIAPRPRRRAAVAMAVEPEDDVLELNQPAPESEESMPAAAQPASKTDPIISSEAAEASRARLDSLSRLVVKPEVTGGDTLEGLVREMLKPMLREWLDANLPELVERLVAKEISRISGQ
jgi:uncharacterized protein